MPVRLTYPLVKHDTYAASFYTGENDTNGNKLFDTAAGAMEDSILRLYVEAGSVTGTSPTLDVKVQGAPTTDTNLFTAVPTWSAVGSGPVARKAAFTQATTAGLGIVYPGVLPRYLRVVNTLGGSTPSFKFSVWLEANQH